MSSRKLKVLLLCDLEHNKAGTLHEHVLGFRKFSKHDYRIVSSRGDLLAAINYNAYDAIVLHYSLVACMDQYVSAVTRKRIRNFQGYKAVFVQDDYRFINRTLDALAYMKFHTVYGLAGPDIIDQVYIPERLPGMRRETVLAGYVPEELAKIEVPPYAERSLDVGYRARKVQQYIGTHTLQKWQIGEKFKADAARYGLKVDISWREEDRIYGDDWIAFSSHCKATLGTESGASVCDFTGEIQTNVERHLALHPEASFEELRELYFKDVDGKIMMNVISPRCFEAAALRTLMILYEGEYSGILKPWRHYVPLNKDHSNMDEVVAILRDPKRAQAIIDQAFEELILSGAYSFRTHVARVDSIMEERLAARGIQERMRHSPPKRMLEAAYYFILYYAVRVPLHWLGGQMRRAVRWLFRNIARPLLRWCFEFLRRNRETPILRHVWRALALLPPRGRDFLLGRVLQ